MHRYEDEDDENHEEASKRNLNLNDCKDEEKSRLFLRKQRIVMMWKVRMRRNN